MFKPDKDLIYLAVALGAWAVLIALGVVSSEINGWGLPGVLAWVVYRLYRTEQALGALAKDDDAGEEESNAD